MSVLTVASAIVALVKATNDAIGATKPALFFGGENVPTQQAAWLRASVLWGDGKTETGGTGVSGNLLTGVLHLSFFDLPGEGEGKIYGFVVPFRNAFSRVKVGGAQFYAPSGAKPVNGDPEWLQLVVECPFDYREP